MCHISSVKHLVKFQDMNGTTVLCLCTEITVKNMNHFTVLRGTEIITNITNGHYFNCTVPDKKLQHETDVYPTETSEK
jgi:hypothetical protein